MKLRYASRSLKKTLFQTRDQPSGTRDRPGSFVEAAFVEVAIAQMRMNEAGAKSPAIRLLRTWRGLKLQAIAIIAQYNGCAVNDFRNFNSKLFRWQRYHETIHGLAERDVRGCIGESLGLTGCLCKARNRNLIL